VLEKCKELRLQDFEDAEIYNILGRAEMEGQAKVYITYTNILMIITQIASVVSISSIILSWNSYIFLLIFITPIIYTIVNTRIGYINYKMRMERMNEVRKTSYIQLSKNFHSIIVSYWQLSLAYRIWENSCKLRLNNLLPLKFCLLLYFFKIYLICT